MRLLWVLLLLLTVSPAALAEKRDKNLVIPLPININQASARELALVLDGVGARKAEAIVVYRELHGPFRSVEELTQVKGIGPGTLARNLGRISVE